MKWTWMAEVGSPPATNPGDDIEVMWHGGTTARGNLHHVIRWGSVMAYRLHGQIPHSDLDTVWNLEWRASPGVNRRAVA